MPINIPTTHDRDFRIEPLVNPAVRTAERVARDAHNQRYSTAPEWEDKLRAQEERRGHPSVWRALR